MDIEYLKRMEGFKKLSIIRLLLFLLNFPYLSQMYPLNFTIQQEITFRFGGSEANLVLTDILRKNILLDEGFNYNYGLAYLYGSNDMPGYTAFVHQSSC